LDLIFLIGFVGGFLAGWPVGVGEGAASAASRGWIGRLRRWAARWERSLMICCGGGGTVIRWGRREKRNLSAWWDVGVADSGRGD